MTDKHTSDKVASESSDVLKDGRMGDDSKTSAGSAMSQAGEGGKGKHTGDAAAEAASDVLQDDSTSSKSKSVAGSTLSQADKKD